ncbi:SPOR domain-containing protein [Psychromarinibacter sp. C21-152]|uniref:SPOR domain-containing protein n=1 Tax=Psychromarinibacter sediminicola TaxID=3033385 RepID=A0AAE3NVG2_9RHOB|nr:SPOR domain-containing protein [Psychromarinibacter sediminicola]MDF0602846.1 SPOR domain-containing protein [Psychromarinibacter sediminicola]
MNRLLAVTALTIGLSVGIGTVHAQSLRNTDGPAEFPPASYTGKQYVDSKGCVFVRAGFDGSVTWVPRVDRNRKVICGATPTFANASPPPSSPAPEPETPPRRTVETAPPPTQTAPPPRQTTPPPRTRVVTAPPPAATTPPKRTTPPPANTNTACPGLSPLAQRYVKNSGHAVRCGPQAANPYVSGDASGVISVPKPPTIAPPPGYKSAFGPEEDRFNPNRGHVTREGFVQMRLVWTAGVPRRLVEGDKGRYYAVNATPTPDREFVLSTKDSTPESAAETPAPAGHRFVQVGLFATPEKAKAAARGLSPLGLPVRLAKATSGGRSYTMVLAGPFNSAAQLQNGLNAVKGVGYTGAVTR